VVLGKPTGTQANARAASKSFSPNDYLARSYHKIQQLQCSKINTSSTYQGLQSGMASHSRGVTGDSKDHNLAWLAASARTSFHNLVGQPGLKNIYTHGTA